MLICDLFMCDCDMINPIFISSPDIRQIRNLLRFRMKLTYQITIMKNQTKLSCRIKSDSE